LQQVASTRQNERKKAERLRLNSTYFIIWFPKLGERLSNTTHFICCLNGRKLRIFNFFFEWKNYSTFNFPDRRKSPYFIFQLYFTVGLKISILLHYTRFISLHQVEHNWVFSVPFSCTSQYGNYRKQKINTLIQHS
jgi:hypothetical protein